MIQITNTQLSILIATLIFSPLAAQAQTGGKSFPLKDDTVVLWDFTKEDPRFLIPDLGPAGLDLRVSEHSTQTPSWITVDGLSVVQFPGGVDFRPNVPNLPAVDLPTGEVTVEAWLRVSDESFGQELGVMSYTTSEHNGFRFSVLADRRVSWLIQSGSGEEIGIASHDKIPEEAWVHVAVTFDGSVMRVYVGGELSEERDVEEADIQPSDNQGLVVGMIGGQGPPHFRGHIAAIRISSTARSEFDVQ